MIRKAKFHIKDIFLVLALIYESLTHSEKREKTERKGKVFSVDLSLLNSLSLSLWLTFKLKISRNNLSVA